MDSETDSQNAEIFNWIRAQATDCIKSNQLPIAEFLLQSILDKGCKDPRALIQLAELKGESALRYKEIWDIGCLGMQYYPDSEIFFLLQKTVRDFVLNYKIDDIERKITVDNLKDYLSEHTDRGNTFPLQKFQNPATGDAFNIYQVNKVSVVGPSSQIMDLDEGILFTNSFTSHSSLNEPTGIIDPVLSVKKSGLKPISVPVAHLSGLWSGNFFHWMLELLPRVILLLESGYDGFFLTPYANHPFLFESLEMLGIGSEKLIQYNPYEGVFCDSLYTTDNFNFLNISQNEWVLRELRSRMLEKVFSVEPRSKVLNNGIYIQRKGNRSVKNEDQILPILEKYNLTPVLTETLRLTDQISLANTSKMIVGPHGAGLVLSLFMEPNSFLVEFLAANQVNACFSVLADYMNHRHYAIPTVPVAYDRENERVEPSLHFLSQVLKKEFG